jgi:ribosomal protein S18 acetylase RimI-like enzyme
MQIVNSTQEDFDEIFRLYAHASTYMEGRGTVTWPEFDREMVHTEITENRQWKLLIGGQTACIWATTFSDPQIWGERNADPSVYIHRIATHPDFRGRKLVNEIVTWARIHAQENGKQFIRLDTVGNNRGLIKLYTNCGFRFLGLFPLTDATGLPAHYRGAMLSLFEIELDKEQSILPLTL